MSTVARSTWFAYESARDVARAAIFQISAIFCAGVGFAVGSPMVDQSMPVGAVMSVVGDMYGARPSGRGVVTPQATLSQCSKNRLL